MHRSALTPRKSHLCAGDLVLDLSTREVYRRGARISLTRTEYSLLERLMRAAGDVVPRELLIASLGREVGGNTLEAFVRLLRNKVDYGDQQKLIHTVRGVGYMVRADYQA